ECTATAEVEDRRPHAQGDVHRQAHGEPIAPSVWHTGTGAAPLPAGTFSAATARAEEEDGLAGPARHLIGQVILITYIVVNHYNDEILISRGLLSEKRAAQTLVLAAVDVWKARPRAFQADGENHRRTLPCSDRFSPSAAHPQPSAAAGCGHPRLAR